MLQGNVGSDHGLGESVLDKKKSYSLFKLDEREVEDNGETLQHK